MITAPNPVTDVSFDIDWVVRDPNPTGARTEMLGGRVCFDNAGYRVTVGDDDTVHIVNKATAEQYLAWGPPQLWVDGLHAFDFYGTTTLELQDGTKITITTSPWADDPLVTVSDKVTISNAGYGVEVLGLASLAAGDLRFVETLRYGWLLDAVVADGNTIAENAAGAGFVGEAAAGVWQAVDQAYIEATDLAVLGPLAGERGQAFLSLSSLLAITFVGAFRGPLDRLANELDDALELRPLQQPDAERELLRLRLARKGPRVALQVPAARWGTP